jgi:hypothetical protein
MAPEALVLHTALDVAVHAGGHVDRDFLRQNVVLSDVAVASLAPFPGPHVLAVTEDHVAGRVVNRNPVDDHVRSQQLNQLLNRRVLRNNRLMAINRLRQASLKPLRRGRMTPYTLDTLDSMNFVTER